MPCPKIRNKEEAETYVGKRVIIYAMLPEVDTGNPVLASVSGILRETFKDFLCLNWVGSNIFYNDIKRVIVRD